VSCHRTFAPWVIVTTFLAVNTAHAAHPLLTEDTGTQGAGNAELEHGLSWTREGSERSFAFQPQLSYGLFATFDVIAQPSWLSIKSPGTGTRRGFGDTALDAKWRFYGDAPLSLAVRAGLLLPTSERELGLPHGTTSAHALLVATVDAVPWTFHGNLGYVRNPNAPGLRREAGHASAAAMFAVNERWTLTVDAGIDSNSDPVRSDWQGIVLGGVIYTVRPGLDVDIGFQQGLHRDAASKQWLLGLTYRWAP
jgi:Putative MetA-pathway of phenol degradation